MPYNADEDDSDSGDDDGVDDNESDDAAAVDDVNFYAYAAELFVVGVLFVSFVLTSRSYCCRERHNRHAIAYDQQDDDDAQAIAARKFISFAGLLLCGGEMKCFRSQSM